MAQEQEEKKEKKPQELPRVWRKHVLALIAATSTQLLQILLTLTVIIVSELIHRPIPLQVELGLAVVICGIWTTGHLVKELAQARRETKEKTPLSRRRTLLSKITSPLQIVIAVVSGISSVGLSLAILASLFMKEPWLWWAIVSYYVFLALWLGAEIIDWYNDQYILREDRIIDITRIPIIYEQRTEVPLAMVQNATTSQKGLGVLLNYGDVQVETAGAAHPIMFEFVSKPKEIQKAIFYQIDALARKKQQREREERAAQTQRWFEAYHTLTSGIREIRYERMAPAGRPLSLSWMIEGAPGRPYRTWVVWDVVSRAGGDEYMAWSRPGGRLPYAREDEVDGIGSGEHHMRGWIAPADARAVYCRVVVWFAGERLSFSSPEMMITLVGSAFQNLSAAS